LFPSIIEAMTLRAAASFHVLNGVGTRPKALFSANRTGYVTGSMYLNMHLEVVATRELATTLVAVVGTIHAVITAGISIAFEQLVGCAKTLTLGTATCVAAAAAATVIRLHR
jgi:hypothetical protein